MLVDARGVPLSLIVTGTNRHDVTQLVPVLDAVVVPRPKPRAKRSENLCADAGFTGQPADRAIRERGYRPHVHSRAKERQRRIRGYKPRRWVVEVTHSWFNRFRKLLVRYEKLQRSFLALNMLAAAIICFRNVPAKINIIYG